MKVFTVDTMAALDNNRNGRISFGTDDLTWGTKPFLFWLNDNQDVWGGPDYPAAQSLVTPSGFGQLDSESPQIGSSYDVHGNLSPSAARREVFQRDLEDFAAMTLRWPKAAEDHATHLRFTLESPTDPEMQIRVFESIRGTGWWNGTYSATSHVDDPDVIEHLFSIRNAPEMRVTTTEPYVFEFAQGGHPELPDLEEHYGNVHMPLIFEGVRGGQGKIVIELMSNDHVLASTKLDLKLRRAKELYDHYSVAYRPNVNADGTFRSESGFDPLDLGQPVPWSAQAAWLNQERQRFQDQSDDYFMFVHSWRMRKDERQAFAEIAFKHMYWSGYKGQFGMFSWPTEWVAEAAGDPGNFNRSEFVAWHSAAGLHNSLHTVRSNHIPGDGQLSVMAHSMGSVVLSEALYRNQTAGQLVDTAILSQGAVSSHYYTSRTDLLPSIYLPGKGENHMAAHTIAHHNPAWTEYKGFSDYGQGMDAMGGLTPRFRGIWQSAERILNYYNPDDYALASWKLNQALKPSSLHDPSYAGWLAWTNIDYAGVELSPSWLEIWLGLTAPRIPGYGSTTHIYDASSERFVRQYRAANPDYQILSTKPLMFATGKYEMFAFGASSIVSAVGGVSSMAGLGGVFDVAGSVNLSSLLKPDGTTAWNTKNTGHSAQFVHSFSDVAPYWRKLVLDIQ